MSISDTLVKIEKFFNFLQIRFCEAFGHQFWPWPMLLPSIAERLFHYSEPELHDLMELPTVRLARARQLYSQGYKTLGVLAKADPEKLVNDIPRLTRRHAVQMISAAKALVVEKLNNIQELAQDVVQGVQYDRTELNMRRLQF